MLTSAMTPLIALALAVPALAGPGAAGPAEPSAPQATSGATLGDAAEALGAPGPDEIGSLARRGNDPVLRGADLLPPVVSLPDGFAPEGLALGYGAVAYAGSTVDGAVWRGDVVTGRGQVLVPGQEGRTSAGLEVDRRGRLWVSGGASGTARVYDGVSGAELATYQLLPAGTGFVNDVVVTARAAYFTDSQSADLQVVPIASDGSLGEARALPLTGDLQLVDGFNLNGIETTPDGRALLAVQSATGLLFQIDPTTGLTTRVSGLEDGALSDGDGLLRQGTTLYAVQNRMNTIAVVRLDASGTTGRLTGTLTDSDLDVPTTIGLAGPFLYAVNARFGTEVTPTTRYDVVRVTRN